MKQCLFMLIFIMVVCLTASPINLKNDPNFDRNRLSTMMYEPDVDTMQFNPISDVLKLSEEKDRRLLHDSEIVDLNYEIIVLDSVQISPRHWKKDSITVHIGKDVSLQSDSPNMVDVVTENRSMNLDFVRTMESLSPISTFSFTNLMERSFYPDYVFEQRESFVLNIQANATINLGGKNWYGSHNWCNGNKNNRARILHSLVFMPATRIRIFKNDDRYNDFSRPVRTPDYTQGASWYFTHTKFWKRPKGFEKVDWKKPQSYRDSLRLVNYKGDSIYLKRYHLDSYYMKVQGYHHSDGQDGWDLRRKYDHENDSLFNQFIKETGELNTYNGDFGINVVADIALAWHRENEIENYIWCKIRPNGRSVFMRDRKRTHTVVISYSFPVKKLGAMELINPDSNIYNKKFYAANRLNLSYTYVQSKNEQEMTLDHRPNDTFCDKRDLVSSDSSAWYTLEKPKYNEKFRIITELTYLMDNNYWVGNLYDPHQVKFTEVKRRLNLVGTIHLRIPGSSHGSFFGQIGYYGSDPYNMFFMTSRLFARMGIGWGFFVNGDSKSDYGPSPQIN